jgi:hypothetical protein
MSFQWKTASITDGGDYSNVFSFENERHYGRLLRGVMLRIVHHQRLFKKRYR